MDLSPLNIQRITKWIQSEVDYNFLNPGYTYAFKDDQVLLEQNGKKLKQVCPHCLLVPRYLLFYKCGHLSCLPCLREYRRYKFIFEKVFPSPICQQSCRLDEIYTWKINVITQFQWKCSKRQSLFALTQNVESPKHYKKFIITKWSNVFIGVFYVQRRVVI